MRSLSLLLAAAITAGTMPAAFAQSAQDAPPPTYNTPPPGYQGPPPGYQQGPPPGYQGPPPGYQGQPPAGYQGPPPGEGGPPPGAMSGPGAPGAGPHQGIGSRFAAANVTHDGRLTLEQAQAANMRMVVRHFGDIDRDRKGYVTLQDLKEFRHEVRAEKAARGGPPPQGAPQGPGGPQGPGAPPPPGAQPY